MGHNIGNRERRANILSGRVADYLEWPLVIWCARCRDRSELRMQALAERHGARRVGKVVERLRCSMPKCGSRPSHVLMTNRLHQVRLVGPGAYG